MEIDFWAKRWKEGRIGFHESRPNAFLARHVERLGQSRRVLVPFCGKTEDLAFLASHGHDVVGVEAVEDAVQAFFTEHGLDADVRVTEEKHGRAYSVPSRRITIFCGDFLGFTPEELGRVDALYDRAALVALPPQSRPRYVEHVRRLLAPGATGLLVTFEYASGALEGPPFPVAEADVRALFDGAPVEALDSAPADTVRFRDAGVSATERCFMLAT